MKVSRYRTFRLIIQNLILLCVVGSYWEWWIGITGAAFVTFYWIALNLDFYMQMMFAPRKIIGNSTIAYYDEDGEEIGRQNIWDAGSDKNIEKEKVKFD